MPYLQDGFLAPNEEQATALLRLKSSQDWDIISGWFEDSLKALGCNKQSEEFAARWAQGQGQSMARFVFIVETSEERVLKMRRAKADGLAEAPDADAGQYKFS